MARFYGTLGGPRGNSTKQNPDYATLNGWDTGVKIIPRAEGKDDVFEIWATGGSNGSHVGYLIGEVIQTSEGPVFSPSDRLAEHTTTEEEDGEDREAPAAPPRRPLSALESAILNKPRSGGAR